MSGILTSHIRQGGYRNVMLLSVAGHVLLFLFFIFGVELLPRGQVIVIGGGVGGGQGGFTTVGLVAEASGGAGMVKPSPTPAREAVPPAPRREEPAPAPTKAAPPEAPDPNVFVEKAASRRPRQTAPPAAKQQAQTPAPKAGQIPRTPDPGAGGPGGGSPGSGGGYGGGVGIHFGTGSGEGEGIDSWYVRQVEQRIGGNWLRTSLGQLGSPVQSIISFEVSTSGEISNIKFEKASGVRAVDLAAERAIRASNPLPPLPYELRRMRVRFLAHFDYPPR
jgi:TonB family protein